MEKSKKRLRVFHVKQFTNRIGISRKNVKSTGALHSTGKIREDISNELAISGSMTAKEFTDMIFLKPQHDKIMASGYHYPEVFKSDSAPMMSNAESDESVRQAWIRKGGHKIVR